MAELSDSILNDVSDNIADFKTPRFFVTEEEIEAFRTPSFDSIRTTQKASA